MFEKSSVQSCAAARTARQRRSEPRKSRPDGVRPMTSQRDGLASALAAPEYCSRADGAECCGRRARGWAPGPGADSRCERPKHRLGCRRDKRHRDELPRQQVHGDGIRAERIDDDHVEAVRLGTAERDPAVANHDVDVRRAHSRGT